MKFEFEGHTREIDLAGIGLVESIAISERMGMTLMGWQDTLGKPETMDWLKAVQCFYWLMLVQAGEADGKRVDPDLNFPVLKFGEALAAAYRNAVEEAGVAEPDPTKPAALHAVAEQK